MNRANTSIHVRRRAFTMVETILGSLMVGTLLVSSIALVGQIRRSQAQLGESARGELLASQLMAEILERSFADPDGVAPFGPDGAEEGGRARFDDVDDYDGWSESPPRLIGGAEIAGLDGWTREVDVAWVASDDLTLERSSPTSLKRITVSVRRDKRLIAQATALRAAAWKTAEPQPLSGQHNSAPVAVIETASTTRRSNESIAFSADATWDADGGTLNYAWDFGDGGVADGVNASHEYDSVGVYTVTLVVTDDDGGIGVASLAIRVRAEGDE